MKKPRYLFAFLVSTFLILAVSLGVLCAAVFFGVFDTVERSYQTKAEAEADRLFERGWLPRIIPASSARIQLSSNLDINTSTGSFKFDPAELDEFVRSIEDTIEQDRRWIGEYPRMKTLSNSGYLNRYYRENGTIWHFFIHPKTGHCEYWAHNI